MGSRNSTALPPVSRAGLSCPATATGSVTQEKPPPTPCPPRMAVPNSSPPATSSALVQTLAVQMPPAKPAVEAREQEESDEEDDEPGNGAASVLAINLASLQGAETAEGDLEVASVPASSPKNEESESRLVISSVSTLALHLQRAKPNEWNELIQVVLQGL